MNDLYEDLRAWIVAGMARRGWTKAELARRSKQLPATIGSIIEGDNIQRPGPDKIRAIEEAFHERFTRQDVNFTPLPPPPLSGAGGESRAVPVVPVSRFPAHVRGGEMLKLIRYSAALWRFCSVQDPDAFGVQLEANGFDARAGDSILFSPATKPAPGKLVAFVIEEKLLIGVYGELEGSPIVHGAGGALYRAPDILGTAIDLWRSL